MVRARVRVRMCEDESKDVGTNKGECEDESKDVGTTKGKCEGEIWGWE